MLHLSMGKLLIFTLQLGLVTGTEMQNDAAKLVLNSFDTSAGPIPDEGDVFKKQILKEGDISLEYTDSPSVHGSGALRISYHVYQVETWGGYAAINHVNNRTYPCSEPGKISFWYNVEEKSTLPGRVTLRLILAEGSEVPGPTDFEPTEFERYYAFFDVLEQEPGWHQVVVDLVGSDDQNDPFWRTGWSGISGNRVLNPSTIRGYSFEVNIGGVTDGIGNNSKGVFLLDGFECTGRNLLASAFDFKSWESALAQNEWWQDVFTPNAWSFPNRTYNGVFAYSSNGTSSLTATYSLSSSQTMTAAYLLPGIAYYNLSLAEEIIYKMKVEDASSLASEFKFTMLDATNCISSCNNAPGAYLKNFTQLHALADVSSSKEVSVSRGTIVNSGFNTAVVKGFRYDVISNGSQAVAAGVMFLEGLRAPGYAEGTVLWRPHDSAALVLNSFDTSAGPILEDIFEKQILKEGDVTLEYVDTPRVHGSGALRISYHVYQVETWGGYAAINHVSNRSYACSQPGKISFWYNVEEKSTLPGRVTLRLILAEGSEVPGPTDFEPTEFERYYAFFDVLEQEPGWHQVVVDLVGSDDQNDPFWRTGWSGISGNRVLNPSTIRGYSFEVNIGGVADGMGNNAKGVFLLDGFECTGRNLLSSAFDSISWENALKQNEWWQDVFTFTGNSENIWSFPDRTSHWVSNYSSNGTSALVAKYSLSSSSQTNREFMTAAYLLPSIAYYNLSKAEAIAFKMKVEDASSQASSEFTFTLLDASKCTSSCNNAPGGNLNNFSQLYDLADVSSDSKHVSLRLDGPIEDSGFNTAVVKGFRYDVTSNGLPAVATGVMFLEGLRAPGKPVVLNTATEAEFVIETGISYNLWIQSNVRYRSNVPKKEDCAKACMKWSSCIFFTFSSMVHIGRNCALTDKVLGESIVQKTSNTGGYTSTSAHISGWLPSRRPDACGSEGVCQCTETVVNCSSSAITILPNMNPEAPDQWEVLSLQGTQISSLTQLMLDPTSANSRRLSSTWGFSQLHLGSSVIYLDKLVFDVLPQLTTITSDLPLGDIILDLTQPFLDVHCDPKEIQLGSVKAWTCDMAQAAAGDFCKYKPYVFYSEWLAGSPIVAQHRASDALFGWVATSPTRCCEYCEMTRDCSHWVLDKRETESEATCYLRRNGDGASEELDELDVNGGPGYVSGYTPEQRAKDAEVGLDVNVQSVTLSTVNSYSLEYSVSISGEISCGAVWITPQAVGVNGEVVNISFNPAMVVFYNGTKHEHRKITITSPIPQIGGEYSFRLRHSVQGCDTAWSFLTANYLQLLQVLPDACVPGEVLSSVTGACDPCPVGTHQKSSGDTVCTKCAAGKISPMRATTCTDCAPGKFSEDSSQFECFVCAAGRFAQSGQESCEICSAGSYQDEKGKGECKLCSGTYLGTTSANGAQNAEACFCKEGTYYRPGGFGCTDCSKGLACPEGRDTPSQESRFYVEIVDAATKDYDVFECATESWCPQGPLETCTFPRAGRSCARVENKKCQYWVLLSIPLFMAVLYVFYLSTAGSHYGKVTALLMLSGNLSIALSSMQAINVYLLLFEEVPKELQWLFQFVEIFMFKWQGFLPECNINQSFSGRLGISILPPLAIVACSTVNWAITNALQKTPATKFVKRMEFGFTWNSIGMLIQVMYIMQCKDAFSYFASKSNPCDKDTLQDFTDVVFFSSEHVAAGPVLITTYLWLVYVIGTYAVFSYTVLTAKSQISNQAFWCKWKFIFGRWRPACRHWGCLLLLRNLIIALIPICVRTDQLYRALAFVAVLGTHAIFEAAYMPWLTTMNNMFEVLVSSILIAMGIVGLGFHDSATDNEKSAAAAVMVFFMICIWASMILSVAYAIFWGTPKAVKARQAQHSKISNELLEKSAGILETIHGDKDVKGRWNLFSKAITSFDKKSFETTLEVLYSFENLDPLTRRMQSRISITQSEDEDELPGIDDGKVMDGDEHPQEAEAYELTNKEADGEKKDDGDIATI